MVDDQQVAEAAHPVRVHHLAGGDRPHLLAFGGADEHALRGRRRLGTVGVPKRPISSPRTGRRSWPLRAENRPDGARDAASGTLSTRRGLPVARARTRREHLADFLDQARQARLSSATSAWMRFFALADLAGDALQHAPALAAFLEQLLAFGAAARLDRRQFASPCSPSSPSARASSASPSRCAPDHARRVARNVGQVMEPARRVGEVFAGKRDAHEVRSASGAGGRAAESARAASSRPSAPCCASSARSCAPRRAASWPMAARASRASDLLRLQRAVGRRKSRLRRRAARRALRAGRFRGLRAPCASIRCGARKAARSSSRAVPAPCAGGTASSRIATRTGTAAGRLAVQAFAFPCAATAATRFATSAGSPR